MKSPSSAIAFVATFLFATLAMYVGLFVFVLLSSDGPLESLNDAQGIGAFLIMQVLIQLFVGLIVNLSWPNNIWKLSFAAVLPAAIYLLVSLPWAGSFFSRYFKPSNYIWFPPIMAALSGGSIAGGLIGNTWAKKRRSAT